MHHEKGCLHAAKKGIIMKHNNATATQIYKACLSCCNDAPGHDSQNNAAQGGHGHSRTSPANGVSNEAPKTSNTTSPQNKDISLQ
jgi:hypothetical protein